MRRPGRRPALWSALWLAGAASGCAHPPPPAAPPTSPTARIDGTYKGLANGSCGSGGATVVVHDGRFTLSVGGDPMLDGAVQPDGALRAATLEEDGREVNFAGHIDGADLRGGSYNGRCAYAFTLARA
jgi:hypothetical protein